MAKKISGIPPFPVHFRPHFPRVSCFTLENSRFTPRRGEGCDKILLGTLSTLGWGFLVLISASPGILSPLLPARPEKTLQHFARGFYARKIKHATTFPLVPYFLFNKSKPATANFLFVKASEMQRR